MEIDVKLSFVQSSLNILVFRLYEYVKDSVAYVAIKIILMVFNLM